MEETTNYCGYFVLIYTYAPFCLGEFPVYAYCS